MTRPMALTPLVTKFFQWLVMDHMKDYIDTSIYPCTLHIHMLGEGLPMLLASLLDRTRGNFKYLYRYIGPHQYGYRRNWSPADAVSSVIYQDLRHFSSAFNALMIPQTFINKLVTPSTYFCNLLLDFLTNRPSQCMSMTSHSPPSSLTVVPPMDVC